jgi:hypothetical protein
VCVTQQKYNTSNQKSNKKLHFIAHNPLIYNAIYTQNFAKTNGGVVRGGAYIFCI